jgi:hypothetical protein
LGEWWFEVSPGKKFEDLMVGKISGLMSKTQE